MTNNLNLKNIKAIILGVLITFGGSYAIAAWSDPTCSPPNCNISTPINATTFSQAKLGALAVGSVSLNTPGYIFSAINGPSFFNAVETNRFLFADGNTQRAGKLLVSNKDGVASWRTVGTNIATSSFTVTEFSINVPRNSHASGGVSRSIPATYQYCAISQIGPDYANSNNDSTECSVNRNANATWTLHGDRSDDPDFICKAQCFYSSQIVITP